MKTSKLVTWLFLFAAMCVDGNATSAVEKTQLWVYTSIYKEFAAPIKAAFEKQHPDVEVQIFQAGSEKLQAKLEAELSAKSPQADLLLTSDPFWSSELEKRGLVYVRPGHKSTETNYYSMMVIIAHKNTPADKRPKSFKDLTLPEFKGTIQLSSPLESGTMFTAVAYLSKKYGWDYFSDLRKNDVASNGGNSTVIQKVESGEKKFGIVLLENALASVKRGSPIEVIYPADGSIAIPSVQVILKDSKKQKAASDFADFVLSTEGQKLLRNGFMYAVDKSVGPPDGAKPFNVATKQFTPWTAETIRDVAAQSKAIKRKFADLVLE